MLLSTGLSGPAIVATDAAISLVTDSLRMAMFGGYSLIDNSTFVTGAIIGAITIPGSWCARWLTTRMAAHLHIAVIEGLLVVASIYLVISALRG